MKSYQYQVIRYLHDHFTGEYVNIGIVVYNPEYKFLGCKITNKYQRITSMFPDANGKWIMKVLRDFEAKLHQSSNRLTELFQPSVQIEHVTGSMIPNDDTAIRLSESFSGLDIDFNTALEDLFSSLVEKHIDDPKKDTLLDEDIWKKKYKQYFEQYSVIGNLKTHEVRTKNDRFIFDKAWKNDIWHCYEPLSFIVKKKGTVKEKVYRWAGKIQGLQNANEPLHITLMTSFSPNHKNMATFVKDYLLKEYNNLHIEIVTDDQAEVLAKSVAEKMKAHIEGLN